MASRISNRTIRDIKSSTMGEVEDIGNSLSEWSWEENKLFELALAVVDEGNPDRWKEVASMLGGSKSTEEVQKHYEALLKDLVSIESGSLDRELSEAINSNQSIFLTDEDQALFSQLILK